MTINNAECLLCHTVYTGSFVDNGSHSWRCTRCGQRWDAARIAAVTNYQQWVKAEAATMAHGAAE